MKARVLFLSLLLLAGCGAQGPQRVETQSYEVPATAALRVVSKGGRVDVVAAGAGVVRVTETLRYRGERPVNTHPVDGGELRLTSGCGDDCGVSYRVEVPPATAVRVDSDGGAVTVNDLAGTLDLDTGGGRVDGVTAGPPSFAARTGGGAVEVRFTAPPGQVDVRSGGGGVTLRLPNGRYALDVAAEGGTTTIGVTDDRGSDRRVKVSSGGGSVHLDAAAP